jgi:CRP-like cAMP-binding protein
VLSDGRRQVLGFFLPGDTINFALHDDPVAPCTVECLTDVTVADIEPLRRHVANAMWKDAVSVAVRATIAMDEVITLASIGRLARQSAYERLALLLLELRHRLSLVYLSDMHSFHLPVTQQVLSEALGLSVVHVNRTLMQLRRDGLVDRRERMLTIPDPEALAALVDFVGPTLGPPARPVDTSPPAAEPARVAT